MGTKVTALDAISVISTSDLVPIVDVSDTSMAASGTTKYIALSQFRDALSIDTDDSVVFLNVDARQFRTGVSGASYAIIDTGGLDVIRFLGRNATSKVVAQMRIHTNAPTIAGVASYGQLYFDTSGADVRLRVVFPDGTTKTIADDT